MKKSYNKALINDDCTAWMTNSTEYQNELSDIEEAEKQAEEANEDNRDTLAVFKKRIFK